MFEGTSVLIVILISAILAWGKWKSMSQRRVEDAYGQEQGCLPTKTVYHGNWPLGLDTVVGLIKANANECILSWMQPLHEQMGPNLEIRMVGNAGLVTIDPDTVRTVLTRSALKDGELDWGFGARRDALLPLFGEGIFTQDGRPWRHSRDILRKQFARIQYHNLDIFTEHVELLVSRLRKAKGSIVDLQPLFFSFTLDTTTSLLFGESAGSLREDSEEDELGTSLNEASWFSGIRVQLAYLYWLCCLPRYYRACTKVRKYTDKWVKKALDEKDEKSSDDSRRYDFIRTLYNEYKDRRLIREQLVNVLLAGRDTTALLLTWTFRLLVRHDKVLKRLRDEIESVQDGETDITKTKLQKMPYLKNVITESLRLYPPVPVNIRHARRHTVLPHGGGDDGLSPILVRKHMGIGFLIYHMHRRKDLYGDDALDFRPERWEDGTLQEKVGWGYLPFNGGPRICLGQEFAILEASYAIARIVQEFPDLKLPTDEKNEPIGSERQVISLTLAPVDGCRVRLCD